MDQILYFFGSKFYSIKFVPFFTFFCRFPIKLLKLHYTNIVLSFFFFFVKSEGGVMADLPLIGKAKIVKQLDEERAE